MPVSKNRRKSNRSARTTTSATRRALPPLPDRRAIEGYLARLMPQDRADAVAAAQEVMYDAWEATSKATRISLARKALQRSPLCADAYVLLAKETARNFEDEVEWYRKGVEAGELALGRQAFEEDAGHFWGLLETRPYMRARCGLAVALWRNGQHEDAIGHIREMLRLNPNDNQGMRYALAALLLQLQRDQELGALLAQYKEDGAPQWLYTKALMEFRRSADSGKASRLLAEALAQNKHVPAYLLGKKKLPASGPAYLAWGGEGEAQEFARDFSIGWKQTAGALEWLAAQIGSGSRAKDG